MLSLLLCVAGLAGQVQARNNIAAELLAEGPAAPGQVVDLAIHFTPADGWHGYWSNPGDAGFGMVLDWSLPQGATAAKPQYPVPDTLLISRLMNHVYERDYAVLVPVRLPTSVAPGDVLPIAIKAQWLACTDEICVPEGATLFTQVKVGSGPRNSRFDVWRAAIPPLLETPAHHAATKGRLRLAIAVPDSVAITDPHLFIEQDDLVDYAAVQGFARKGQWIIADLPLRAGARLPPAVTGIVKIGEGEGFAFASRSGPVPKGGVPVLPQALPDVGILLLAALAGGLLLNLMPCVFPILSLKALSLARAGESATQARREGVAYAAGTVVASLALGAVLLLLRAGGEQIGWAFQLQDPRIVVGLLLLAVAITANFAGLFDLPSLSFSRAGDSPGAFATGLLAAFVATPCTGPFMAAAMGAALVLPPLPALTLFAALGLGLGLPFLLLGLVPRLRGMLPRPGPWMERFRHWMAVPMGLTAIALLWLAGRLGGDMLAATGGALALALLVMLWMSGRRQRAGQASQAVLLAAALASFAVVAFAPLPQGGPASSESDVLSARPFSEQALAQARATGRPVFVWFTADWCITCKVNERVAIEREATKAAFDKAGVIALRGDWTRRDPAITRFLTAQGVAGVPLYLWYPANGEPQRLDQLLAPDSLTRLAQSSPGPASGTRRTGAPAPR